MYLPYLCADGVTRFMLRTTKSYQGFCGSCVHWTGGRPSSTCSLARRSPSWTTVTPRRLWRDCSSCPRLAWWGCTGTWNPCLVGRVEGLLLLVQTVDHYEASVGICNVMGEEKDDKEHKMKNDSDSAEGEDIIATWHSQGVGSLVRQITWTPPSSIYTHTKSEEQHRSKSPHTGLCCCCCSVTLRLPPLSHKYIYAF